MNRMKIPGMLGGALVLLASMFGGVQAQSVERPNVTILNDHMHVHKVIVFDALGKRHVLGFVGNKEVKDFDVPAKVEALGPYRIALQQHTPLPQLGVPATENLYKMTPVLEPMPGETVTIIVGTERHLSSVEIVR